MTRPNSFNVQCSPNLPTDISPSRQGRHKHTSIQGQRNTWKNTYRNSMDSLKNWSKYMVKIQILTSIHDNIMYIERPIFFMDDVDR